MPDPTLKRTSVQIKYTASDGYEAEFFTKSGGGMRHPVTRETLPPQGALIEAIDELARLAALFGFEADARAAVENAFSRVAEWRGSRPPAPGPRPRPGQGPWVDQETGEQRVTPRPPPHKKPPPHAMQGVKG